MKDKNGQTFFNIVLIVIFCALIYVPATTGIFEEKSNVSQTEKRALTKLPALPVSLEEVRAYPKAFDAFYSDHFGFRETFNAAYFRLLGKVEPGSSSPDVTLGEDGWMFLGSIKKGYKKYGDPMGDAMHVNLYTRKELEAFARNLSAYSDWLKKRGIAYIFVIAPNKQTIYFDKLPKYIKKQNKDSATDQAVRYLREHTDIVVVDPRRELLGERLKHDVYYRTDTHWNYYAANVAQFEIMKQVERLFPGKVRARLLGSEDFEISMRIGGDLAIMAMRATLKEEEARPVFKNTCDPVKYPPNANEDTETFSISCPGKKLKALIFRDSMFDSLKPYIFREFKRSTYIWENLNRLTLMKYVELEKPDLVIHEIVERSFPYVPDEFRAN